MPEEAKCLYRYRSLQKVFNHNELKDQIIHFSSPETLNDQMESYMNIFWSGDAIALQGFFKYYLFSLLTCVKGDDSPYSLKKEDLQRIKDDEVFRNVNDEFFKSIRIENMIKQMASSKKNFTESEMLFILITVQPYALSVVFKNVYKQKNGGLASLNEKSDSTRFLYDYEFVINALTSTDHNEQLEKMIFSLNLWSEQRRDIMRDKINLISNFPKIYLNKIKTFLFDNFCVACFSNSFDIEPMWAHYADNENGICLKFRVENKDNSSCLNLYTVSGAVADKKDVRLQKKRFDNRLFKVDYNNNLPQVDFFNSLGCIPHPYIIGLFLCDCKQEKFSSACDKYQNLDEWREKYHSLAEKLIRTKLQDWQYEQEYRLIHRGISSEDAKYNISDLDAIIFGRKVQLEDKRKIMDLIRNHSKGEHVKFCDLYYSSVSKKLDVCPIVYK